MRTANHWPEMAGLRKGVKAKLSWKNPSLSRGGGLRRFHSSTYQPNVHTFSQDLVINHHVTQVSNGKKKPLGEEAKSLSEPKPSPVARRDHTLGNSENLQKTLCHQKALQVLIVHKRNFQPLTLL